MDLFAPNNGGWNFSFQQNIDAIYNGWSSYSKAKRTIIIWNKTHTLLPPQKSNTNRSPNNWIITDGGVDLKP
jgi:hypothetical protein